MPSMKRFPEFELAQTLLKAFTDAIGPTHMNRTDAQTRSNLMSLANQTAVQVGLIIEGKGPDLLAYLPPTPRDL